MTTEPLATPDTAAPADPPRGPSSPSWAQAGWDALSERLDPIGALRLASAELAPVGDPPSVARLSGELDVLDAPALEDSLTRMACAIAPRVFTLDIRGLTFVDSAGLRAFIHAHNEASAAGGGVAIETDPGSGPARLLELLGLHRSFAPAPAVA